MSKIRYSNDELVTRAFTSTFRASEDSEATGVIEGTPIVFNQDTRISDVVGEFIERIEPTALKNADMKDVRLFVNHDTNKIALARSKNGNENSTMSFTIDDEGVHIKAQLDVDNNSEAKALYSAIQRGDMDGMSFMFRIKKDTWSDLDKKIPVRTINEISIVHEVSVVNFPAYPQTSVNARSIEETMSSPLEEARKQYAEETASRENELLNIEKMKVQNLIQSI